MARGKYASTAEARRVRESAITEVEAGRRKIAQLVKENAELRAALAEANERYISEMRDLRAVLREGADPMIGELQEQLQAVTVKLGQAHGEVRGSREYRIRFARRAAEYLQSQGVDPMEARRIIHGWSPDIMRDDIGEATVPAALRLVPATMAVLGDPR